MKKEFYVYIEQDEDGFFVGEVPRLRACYAQGCTMDELMKNISQVIEMCLEEQDEAENYSTFVGIQKVTLHDTPANA